MNHIEVTLYFNELQLRALEDHLNFDGTTLKDEFSSMSNMFLKKNSSLSKRRSNRSKQPRMPNEKPVAASASSTFVRTAATDTSQASCSTLCCPRHTGTACMIGANSVPTRKCLPKPSARWSISVSHSMKNSATECPTTTASKSLRISIWMQAQPVPAKAATMRGGRIRSRICRLLRTVPTVAPTAAHTTEKKNSKKPSQARRSSHPKKPRMKLPTRMRTKPR